MSAERNSRRSFLAAGLAALYAGCEHWDAFRYGKTSRSVMGTQGLVTDPTGQIQDFFGIAVGDLIEVKFPYRADLSETVTVREDGMITLPLIDPVFAVGKTPELLQAELVEAYRALQYDPTTAAKDSAKSYLITPNDVLEVKFDSYPQFNDSVTVRPDGKISLALVKTVVAEGKTPEQLETELTKLYSKYLKNPELVVIVRQFTSEKYFVDGKAKRPGLRNLEGLTVIVRTVAQRQVYVGGEVGKPGFIPYQYPLTALQAILAAGGHLRTGKLREVVILRKLNQKEPVILCVNLKQDWSGVGTNDVALRPYDIVIVPKTKVAKVNNFMQQYIYDLVPITKNSTFNLLYQVGQQGIDFPLNNTTGGDGGGS